MGLTIVRKFKMRFSLKHFEEVGVCECEASAGPLAEQVEALARLTRAPTCPLAASIALLPLLQSEGTWSAYGSPVRQRVLWNCLESSLVLVPAPSAAELSKARIDSKNGTARRA